MNQSTKITDGEAYSLKRSWATCLPGELSNLFYHVNKETSELERCNVFKLGGDGIKGLIKLGKGAIECIRIDMGCNEDGKFAPIFTIVPIKGESTHFKLFPQPNNKGQSIITHAISDLFRKKWDALNDEALANAFSGVTCNKIDGKETEPVTYLGSFKARRVKSYDFLNEDACRIVADLKAVKATGPSANLYVKLFLGAGLTVDVTHPFNFRPILSVSSLTKPINPDPGKDRISLDESSDTDYERSRPCPPYC